MGSWYVIRTVPRSEHLAATEIRELGWEVFLPCASSPDVQARRPRLPLFPGYLFVNCPLTVESQSSVSRVRHVAGWVHFEHTVMDVPDEIIRELQSRLETMNRNHGAWTQFKAGQTVYITSQLFEGLAEVADDSVSKRGRINVFLEFMGRMVATQVPWADLQSIETGPPQSPKPSHRRTRGRGRWIRGRGPAVGMAT